MSINILETNAHTSDQHLHFILMNMKYAQAFFRQRQMTSKLNHKPSRLKTKEANITTL